jgi:hypothetical protein
MDLSKYDIIIKRHAVIQSRIRGIHPDLIEDTLNKGKVKRFGKHYINISSQRISCIGRIEGTRLIIITITWKK